jgi:hypothetical protein
MREGNDSADVDIHLMHLFRHRGVKEVLEAPETGVVHQEVDCEPAVVDLGDQTLYSIGGSEIGGDDGDLNPGVLPQFAREPFEFVLRPGHEDQIGALVSQLAGELLTQSCGSAGDKYLGKSNLVF